MLQKIVDGVEGYRVGEITAGTVKADKVRASPRSFVRAFVLVVSVTPEGSCR